MLAQFILIIGLAYPLLITGLAKENKGKYNIAVK